MKTGVVEQLTPVIRRIVAPNPSAMTGTGTNCYLLGRGGDLILVDPGPLIEDHVTALMAALTGAEQISSIVVTHAHLDHSAAAPRLAQITGAPVLAFGAATSGRSAIMERLAAEGLTGGGEGLDLTFQPDRIVQDGDQLSAGDLQVEIIHTPGHLGGHISLGVEDALLSGDHAMGWASSLISPPDGDMRAYMGSLDQLLTRNWQIMLPGHGPEVHEVAQRLRALILHRQSREADILAALGQAPGTPRALAARIYHDTPAALLPAASRNVLAHLIDLTERHLVLSESNCGPNVVFSIR